VKDDVGRLAPPGAHCLKQGGIRCLHPQAFTAVTLARAFRPPGRLRSGRHLAHRDAPLATINGFDPGNFTHADQGSPVVWVLAQQDLELQLVQQVAPAGSAEFASDAERRQLGLRGRVSSVLPAGDRRSGRELSSPTGRALSNPSDRAVFSSAPSEGHSSCPARRALSVAIFSRSANH